MEERWKVSICEAENGGNSKEAVFEGRMPENFPELNTDMNESLY